MKERLYKQGLISSISGVMAIGGAIWMGIEGVDWRVCGFVIAAGVVLVGVKDKDVFFEKLFDKWKGGKGV